MGTLWLPEMEAHEHWLNEGVAHENGAHASNMLHAKDIFGQQKGPKYAYLSQLMTDNKEQSHKAQDTSMRAELPRWPINKKLFHQNVQKSRTPT